MRLIRVFHRRALCRAATAAALLVFVDFARGHSILISRGTVAVMPDRIAVQIEVGGEDFVHDPRLRASILEGYAVSEVREAVERHRMRLLDRFVLRDGEGERLAGRTADLRTDLPPDGRIEFFDLRKHRATYSLEYPLTEPARYLTFQQRIGADAGGVSSQLVLAVRVNGEPTERIIQLTGGGNVETLNVSRQGPADGGKSVARTAEAVMEADRFKAIHAFLRAEVNGASLDVYVPVTLLETFEPIPRADVDFITPAEMAAARDRVAALLARRIAVRLDGQPVAGCAERVRFLGPDETSMAEGTRMADAAAPARRLGAWSARVGVSFRFSSVTRPEEIRLDWDLYNNVVLTASVWEVADNRPAVEHRVHPGEARVTVGTPAKARFHVPRARIPDHVLD